MPRVHHVKKARKDNPAVKKGEPYYHWQRYKSRKQYSATYPKRSQLTSSGKLAQIYDAEDAVTEVGLDISSVDSLTATVEDCISVIESAGESFREVGEEYNESADNLEEYFSGSGQIDDIREKAQACEEAADNCETVVDGLNDVKQRAEELGDEPTREDAESEIGKEEDEDEDDYIEKVDTLLDEKLDEWQTELDDIGNDAENSYGEFEGPQM